jgi:hypothetical protein
MKKLIQDTIKKIENQHITPDPRWKHLIKKYGLWFLFAIILIFGAISLSMAFDNYNSLDQDLYPFMHQGRLMYLLSILPYFWIILMAIFLTAAFFGIRKTETGYRYSWPKILLMIVGGIAIFGILMSLFDFGGRFNSRLTKEVPFYSQHMVVTKESQWMQPAKGFLAGTIISVSGKKLEIKDLNDENWNVSIDGGTLVKPSANISSKEIIKIIGKDLGDHNFKAQEIRPWQGKGMMNGANSSPGGQGKKMMNGNGGDSKAGK